MPFNPETWPNDENEFPYFALRQMSDPHRDVNHTFQNIIVALSAGFVVAAVAVVLFLVLLYAAPSHARDLNGEHANDPLHEWFDQLASGKGLCCSFADGETVKDVDWDTAQSCENGSGGSGMQSVPVCHQHYRVRLKGEWIVVPDNALVTEPNKYGAAVVWPYESEGQTLIRCFMPGAGT